MKAWQMIIVLLGAALVGTPAWSAEKAQNSAVPKYDPGTEVTLKGTVLEVQDRQCPVSGGVGSHFILKIADGDTIEVHLASTKYVQTYDLGFHKGEQLQVTGSKVQFEGVETVFAREVKRGEDVFVFRDKSGKPVW